MTSHNSRISSLAARTCMRSRRPSHTIFRRQSRQRTDTLGPCSIRPIYSGAQTLLCTLYSASALRTWVWSVYASVFRPYIIPDPIYGPSYVKKHDYPWPLLSTNKLCATDKEESTDISCRRFYLLADTCIIYHWSQIESAVLIMTWHPCLPGMLRCWSTDVHPRAVSSILKEPTPPGVISLLAVVAGIRT